MFTNVSPLHGSRECIATFINYCMLPPTTTSAITTTTTTRSNSNGNNNTLERNWDGGKRGKLWCSSHKNIAFFQLLYFLCYPATEALGTINHYFTAGVLSLMGEGGRENKALFPGNERVSNWIRKKGWIDRKNRIAHHWSFFYTKLKDWNKISGWYVIRSRMRLLSSWGWGGGGFFKRCVCVWCSWRKAWSNLAEGQTQRSASANIAVLAQLSEGRLLLLALCIAPPPNLCLFLADKGRQALGSCTLFLQLSLRPWGRRGSCKGNAFASTFLGSSVLVPVAHWPNSGGGDECFGCSPWQYHPCLFYKDIIQMGNDFEKEAAEKNQIFVPFITNLLKFSKNANQSRKANQVSKRTARADSSTHLGHGFTYLCSEESFPSDPHF